MGCASLLRTHGTLRRLFCFRIKPTNWARKREETVGFDQIKEDILQKEERSIYELMNSVFESEDLLLVADRLIEFTEKALKEKNRETIVKHFYERLIQYAMADYIFDETEADYVIYEKKSAVLKFWYLSLPSQKSPVKTLKEIRDIALGVKNNFCEPIGDKIKKETIQEIMGYLDSKYEFANKVFSDQRAIMCILDYSNMKYNSECLVLEKSGIVIQNLFLYHTNKSSDIHPIAVFFHELGHALHARYSGSLNIIPEQIIHFLKELCMPKIEELSDADKAEILADIFGIGLMFNSPFEEYDCFKEIHVEDKEMFNQLIVKMLENMIRRN